MMRRLLAAPLLALALAAPAAAAPPAAPAKAPSPAPEEAVYNVGNLEVKAGDLSRPDIAGAGRKVATEPKATEGARRAARLVDLGEGGLAAASGARQGEVYGSVGTFATVKAGGAWSWRDADGADGHARVDYFSTDGHRFRSDARKATARVDMTGRQAGASRLDLHGELSDGRERLPGAVGSEARFVERTARGYAARAELQAGKGDAPWTGSLEFTGDAVEGTSALLGLDDDASAGTARLRAEWHPQGSDGFALGFDAASHTLDVDRAADVRTGDAGVSARYKLEAAGALVSAEAGWRKAGDRDGDLEGDLSLRRKLDPKTSARASFGARADAYDWRTLLLSAPGYLNLRDAAGANRFAALPRPARYAKYVDAGLRHDLDRGFVDLDLSTEKVDGEIAYVPVNATDARVDAVSCDGATIRVAKLTCERPLDERFRLVASALSRSAEAGRGDLPFRPKSEARLALAYADTRTRAEASLTSLGGFASDFAGGRVGGHAEVGLTFSRDVAENLAVEFAAENLLDRGHDLRPGFPARGRVVSGGIGYKF